MDCPRILTPVAFEGRDVVAQVIFLLVSLAVIQSSVLKGFALIVKFISPKVKAYHQSQKGQGHGKGQHRDLILGGFSSSVTSSFGPQVSQSCYLTASPHPLNLTGSGRALGTPGTPSLLVHAAAIFRETLPTLAGVCLLTMLR